MCSGGKRTPGVQPSELEDDETRTLFGLRILRGDMVSQGGHLSIVSVRVAISPEFARTTVGRRREKKRKKRIYEKGLKPRCRNGRIVPQPITPRSRNNPSSSHVLGQIALCSPSESWRC